MWLTDLRVPDESARRTPPRMFERAMSAISVSGLVKTFGTTRALDGLDPQGRRGRGPRLPRAQRRGQVDDDPHPARPAADVRRKRAAARRRPVARRGGAAP